MMMTPRLVTTLWWWVLALTTTWTTVRSSADDKDRPVSEHFQKDVDLDGERLTFQHNSITVPLLSFDVCRYRGVTKGENSFLSHVRGEPVRLEGGGFAVVFAPAFFHSLTQFGDGSFGERLIAEICFAVVTKCPVRPGTHRAAKFCQESTCVSDPVIAGYHYEPGLNVNGSSTEDESFIEVTLGDKLLFRSRTGRAFPKFTQGGVNILSYHTHFTDRDSTPLFMQVTNPELGARLGVGPSTIQVSEPELWHQSLGLTFDPTRLEDCTKLTTIN